VCQTKIEFIEIKNHNNIQQRITINSLLIMYIGYISHVGIGRLDLYRSVCRYVINDRESRT